MTMLRATWLSLLVAASLQAATFEVSNENDSGSGSLRAAIELANSTPGRDRITFTRSVQTFRPRSPLPIITDSVELANIVELVIDGSDAGASDGLVIAAGNVSITNVTVTSFSGDGIVIRGDASTLLGIQSVRNRNGLRIDGSRNEIYGARIGAGAIVARGPGNRGDGIWITAGASGNIIGRQSLPCPLCTPYSVNVIASNDGEGIRVDGTNNTIDSNEVAEQFGDGVIVSGTGNRLIRNSVDDNGGSGIRLRAPAELTKNIGKCNGRLLFAIEFEGATAASRLDFAIDRGDVVEIAGALNAQPDATYRIDFLSMPLVCTSSLGEFIIGAISVTTDHAGLALFDSVLSKAPHIGEWTPQIGATATSLTTSATSELSPLIIANGDIYNQSDLDVAIHTIPQAMLWDVPSTFEIVAKNNGPSAIADLAIEVPHVPLAQYDDVTTTKGTCTTPSADSSLCTIGRLAVGESVTIRARVTLPAAAQFSLFTFTIEAQTPRDLPRSPNIYSLRVPVYAHGKLRSARH